MGAGCSWCPTRTAPSATSSRRPSTLFARGRSWRSIRRWFDRLWRRPPPHPGASSKKPKIGFGAGVAPLVERNLPKVEVAGSRPVARFITFPPFTSNRGRPGPLISPGAKAPGGAPFLQVDSLSIDGLWSKERFGSSGSLRFQEGFYEKAQVHLHRHSRNPGRVVLDHAGVGSRP